jgi:plastocyanin
MRNPGAWLTLAVLVHVTTTAPAQERTASVAGVVRFTGEVPPAQKIIASDGRTILHNDLVVDPKSRGLRDVVAVLENGPVQPKLAKSKPVLVDQRDMVFVPRVVAVQHGQAVVFDNSDNCNHSVMASSVLKANNFNLFVLQGKPYEHVFEPQKHPIPIGCALHPWMRAWVYVAPHPWFAISDAQGQFQIKDVPPGKYTLWVRHPDTGLQERREVEVQPGRMTDIAIEWKKHTR